MPPDKRLTMAERTQIEALIRAFDDHGCGLGLDIQAQAALRRLLEALQEAEQAADRYHAMIPEQHGTSGRGPQA